MKAILILANFAFIYIGNGQQLPDSLLEVNKWVKSIDNSSLKEEYFNYEEIEYYTNFKDTIPCQIVIYSDSSEVKKIAFAYLSKYSHVNIYIYFNNNIPIKIVEFEEDFPVDPDTDKVFYTERNEVFRMNYYNLNWAKYESYRTTTGARVYSPFQGNIQEFEFIFELTQKLKGKPERKSHH